MTLLRARRLTFSYPHSPPLFRDVDISIRAGECIGLMGASGSGKSSLCHILAGVIPRNRKGLLEGEVLLGEKNINAMPLAQVVQLVGIVFQDPDTQLFSPTVEAEIAFGPENLCLPRPEIARRISHALEMVGMSAHRRAPTATLSRGQKQLIALAAVLALKPRVLVLDEAFSQLDDQATLKVKQSLAKLKTSGGAIFLVDHEAANLELADRIYQLKDMHIREVPK